MGPGATGAQPVSVSVETSDLDEAREVCGEHLYPRSLRLADRSARLSARFAFLPLTTMTVADVRYGAEIAGETGDLGSYHVNLVLAGSFAARQGRRTVVGDAGRAGVYRPVGDNVLEHCSADCHLLGLKVAPGALEAQLSALLDAPVRGPLRLAAGMDVHRSPGRTCAELIRLLSAEIDDFTGLARHPIVAAPLQESLLMALLFAVGHQYQDALRRGEDRRRRHLVTRAIDAVHDEPRRAYTLAVLAAIAEVDVRYLRQEFHRQVGMAPMAYVREVRMAGAHGELRDADPVRTSVAEVARRWGYARPGRFVARYRERYHVGPLETLRTHR